MPRFFALLVLLHAANAFHSTMRPVGQQSATASLLHSTTTTSGNSEPSTASDNPQKKVSVLLCPAQFCVPADYEEFFENLKSTRDSSQQSSLPEIGTCRVASLPRTEWIKVARQLPTRNFLDATLSAKETLGWYFDGIEKALQEIYAIEGSDTNVAIIGHSIGGWVARGYLGGLGGYVRRLGNKRQTIQSCS